MIWQGRTFNVVIGLQGQDDQDEIPPVEFSLIDAQHYNHIAAYINRHAQGQDDDAEGSQGPDDGTILQFTNTHS